MEARIQNPALTIPGLFDALQALGAASNAEGLSNELRELVALRASQINGCSVCLDMHNRGAKSKGGESERNGSSHWKLWREGT